VVRERIWGLYRGNWNSIIVDDAFSHPAKYARDMIYWLVRTGIERGWWTPGETTLLDPFAGVALGGLASAAHGLSWTGVELEQRFVDLGNENIQLHREQWERMGLPIPRLIQGDSRRLTEIVGEIGGGLTSPPYAESLQNAGTERATLKGSDSGMPKDYGTTSGQLGAMPEGKLGGMLSPPFSPAGNQPRIGQGARNELAKEGKIPEAQGLDDPANIARLPIGGVDTRAKRDYTYYVCLGCILAAIAESQSADEVGGVSPAIPSMSVKHSEEGRSQSGGRPRSRRDTTTSQTHSTSPRTAITGKVEEIVGAVTHGESSGERLLNETATLVEELARTPTFSQYITSRVRMKLVDNGITASKISLHSVSPVTEDSTGGSCELCGASDVVLKLKGEATAKPAITANDLIGTSDSIGGERRTQVGGTDIPPEDYWSACSSIYQQLYDLFSPNSYLAIIVKPFVRNKTLVDLPAMTLDLLVQIGFSPVTWFDMMLTGRGKQLSMMPEQVPDYEWKRASFFRRLAESKGSPKIDAEVTLVVRKA